MASIEQKTIDFDDLIAQLNQDRALILEKIDQGDWPELRHDLAALERELSQLLTIAEEKLRTDNR